MNLKNVKYSHILFRIKDRHRWVLLNGRIKSIMIRCMRLDALYIHVLNSKNYE